MKRSQKRKGQPVAPTTGQQMPTEDTRMNPEDKPEYSPTESKKAIAQSRAAQRVSLLRHMKEHVGITTLQARQLLSVMHPAGRILELRRKGFEIVTAWVYDTDSAGKLHKQALYILKRGPK